jgi:hypothetical protein
MKYSTTFSALCTSTTLLFAPALAHSWIEQMNVIGDNGSYTGNPGYMRAYAPRSMAKFNDDMNTWRLPPADGKAGTKITTELLCAPQQQDPAAYTAQYPMLKASPGDYVAIKYLENGHVTVPANQVGKFGSGGLVYVYATTNPQKNMPVANVFSWGFNGTLSQGRLLSIEAFDDLRCHQVNAGSQISTQRQQQFPNSPPDQSGAAQVEQWCETDIQVPKDAGQGNLAIYWVWQWPTMPNVDPNDKTGKDETYTSCADVQIVTDASQKNAVEKGIVAKLINQDPQLKAVSNYKARAANQTLPTDKSFYGPSNPVAGSSSGASSSTPSGPPSSGMIGASPTVAPASAATANTASPAAAKPSVRTTTYTTLVTIVGEVTVPAGVAAPTGAVPTGASKRHLNQHARSVRFHA